MILQGLKAKLHRAYVNETRLDYNGSITICQHLCQMAGILEFERVEVYNCTNGERFSTYVIYGDTGDMKVNGAAARLTQTGDRIIVACYANFSQEQLATWQPNVILLDESNKPV